MENESRPRGLSEGEEAKPGGALLQSLYLGHSHTKLTLVLASDFGGSTLPFPQARSWLLLFLTIAIV